MAGSRYSGVAMSFEQPHVPDIGFEEHVKD
jgi:hypothetical protein